MSKILRWIIETDSTISPRIKNLSNNKIVIFYDGKYFYLFDYKLKGYDEFHTDSASDNVKYEEKAILEDEILIWCVISLAGVS